MQKNIFIVNPTSGKGNNIRFINNLKDSASEENKLSEIDIIYTEGANTAIDIAKFYSNKYPDAIIYSVGGDGTLNEIVNGINCDTKLAIIPVGSGNDFYRIYKDISGTKKIDLGIVNERKFINIASLGIDAKMAYTANEIKTNSKIKLLSYPRAIIKEIIDYKPIEIEINGIVHSYTLFAVCNGKYYGSGFGINPNYNLNNGLLNIINASELTRTEIVGLLGKVLTETHLDSFKVNFYMDHQITLECKYDTICNVDGEIITGKKFEFNTIKDGITLTNDVPQYVKKAIKTIK